MVAFLQAFEQGNKKMFYALVIAESNLSVKDKGQREAIVGCVPNVQTRNKPHQLNTNTRYSYLKERMCSQMHIQVEDSNALHVHLLPFFKKTGHLTKVCYRRKKLHVCVSINHDGLIRLSL